MAPSTPVSCPAPGSRWSGASGVLGSLVAAELERRGARLLVVGRDADRLAALGTGVPVVADLGDAGAGDAVVAAAREHLGGLDGLVNAAGVVAFGPLVDTPDEVVEELFLTNVVGPLFLLRRVLPLLEESRGFVVQVSAVVAERPLPRMAAYSASKAALSAVGHRAAHRAAAQPAWTCTTSARRTPRPGWPSRPLSGEAPALPQGLDPADVARRIVDAVAAGELDLARRGLRVSPDRPGAVAAAGRGRPPGLPAHRRPGRLPGARRGRARRRGRAPTPRTRAGSRRSWPCVYVPLVLVLGWVAWPSRATSAPGSRSPVGWSPSSTTAAVAAPLHGRLVVGRRRRAAGPAAPGSRGPTGCARSGRSSAWPAPCCSSR